MGRFVFSFPAQNPRYYKLLDGDYLVSIGIGDDGEEITEEEYNEIKAIMEDKPLPPAGYDYRLNDQLGWEPYELPPAPDPEGQPVDDPAELLELLLGGGDNG